ncbi:hypothetical protein BDR07DRAFT_1393475 [Suillus spraguei]|nr:hypothetical protein BDR07DRAFT_1393475 [Suillus spraguei]
MPKKSKASKDIVQPPHKSAVAPALVFPDILQKEALECRILLENQIILVDVCFIFVTRSPHSCNSNIRMYKYTPSQYLTEARSEWTVLVYLTGIEDGVEGGETLFYKDERGKPRETIVAPLTRGTVLLHRHGNECLLHEGSLVRHGTKYILRSDLMFM